MRLNGLMRTGVAMLTLAILALTTFAPVAEAGNGNGRGKGKRYKNRSSHTRVVHHRDRVIHRSDSGLGPAIIGFIGGVAVGTAISNSNRDRYRERDYSHDRSYDRDYGRGGGCSEHDYAHARGNCGSGHGYAQADHSYYDPYCEERFSSFDACRSHQRSCSHPKVIKVIVANSGECVDTYRYQNGGWRDCD